MARKSGERHGGRNRLRVRDWQPPSPFRDGVAGADRRAHPCAFTSGRRRSASAPDQGSARGSPEDDHFERARVAPLFADEFGEASRKGGLKPPTDGGFKPP